MALPTGIICLWYGAIVSIPTGWKLCDGNNGTPDLRNRFVVGAGDSYPVDDTGGTADHSHLFTGNGHQHTIGAGAAIAAGANYSAIVNTGSATGQTGTSNNRPPFHALAYIMKT